MSDADRKRVTDLMTGWALYVCWRSDHRGRFAAHVLVRHPTGGQGGLANPANVRDGSRRTADRGLGHVAVSLIRGPGK